MTVNAVSKRSITRKLATTIAGVSFALAIMQPASAAIEIDETDFGPSYETMAVDTVVGKPLQLVTALTGTAAYLVF